MLFGMVSGDGQMMGVLVGDGECQRGRGSFGGEFGTSHFKQQGLCCIVMRKCVNRSSCCLRW